MAKAKAPDGTTGCHLQDSENSSQFGSPGAMERVTKDGPTEGGAGVQI